MKYDIRNIAQLMENGEDLSEYKLRSDEAYKEIGLINEMGTVGRQLAQSLNKEKEMEARQLRLKEY